VISTRIEKSLWEDKDKKTKASNMGNIPSFPRHLLSQRTAHVHGEKEIITIVEA
jgi:hypothetical protein